MKTIAYKNPWTGEELKACFVVDKYANNGRMYIGMLTWNEEYSFYEPWCDITVNIPYVGKRKPTECFVDTNNCPQIDEWLVENHIAKYATESCGDSCLRTKYGYSGFCRYPAMVFNMSRINEYLYSEKSEEEE